MYCIWRSLSHQIIYIYFFLLLFFSHDIKAYAILVEMKRSSFCLLVVRLKMYFFFFHPYISWIFNPRKCGDRWYRWIYWKVTSGVKIRSPSMMSTEGGIFSAGLLTLRRAQCKWILREVSSSVSSHLPHLSPISFISSTEQRWRDRPRTWTQNQLKLVWMDKLQQ